MEVRRGRVADTRRVMRTIQSVQADPELVTAFLAARSSAEATVAYAVLRETLPDCEMLQLANLRALIGELPVGPFRTGESLDILERAAGYEFTGRSFRRIFDSRRGVFGLEFLGAVRECEGIAVHTPAGRRMLVGSEDEQIDEAILPLLVDHAILLDAILEALGLLGCPLEPSIYVSIDDFALENPAAGACEGFELF